LAWFNAAINTGPDNGVWVLKEEEEEEEEEDVGAG